jgi:anti-sigma regulatory factor (Ser/Thr protein kinase)
VYLPLTGKQPLLRTEMRTTDADAEQFVIDASRLKFASPLELAGTAALTHAYAATNTSITLRLPESDEVTSYAQRMNLLEHVSPETKIVGRTPFETRNDCSTKLLEVTPLSSATQDPVIEHLRGVAHAHLSAPHGDRILIGIAELVENAVTHGRSDAGAFIAAQVYTGRTTRQARFEIAVCDTGIGVLEHLRQNRGNDHALLAGCADGLRRALKRGVTGTDEVRGHGLTDLFARTGELGTARVVLRSGNGLARVARYGPTRRMLRRTTECSVPGTWAWARVTFPS